MRCNVLETRSIVTAIITESRHGMNGKMGAPV